MHLTTRRYLSCILSIFVAPGAGQLLNNQKEKGLILFFLWLLMMGAGLFLGLGMYRWGLGGTTGGKLFGGMGTLLLGGLQVYAAVDAFLVGRRLDREAMVRAGEEPPEEDGYMILDPPPEDRPRPAPGL